MDWKMFPFDIYVCSLFQIQMHIKINNGVLNTGKQRPFLNIVHYYAHRFLISILIDSIMNS